jgi:phosphoglycolate phosphatase
VGNGALNQIRLSLPQGTGEEMVQRVLDIYRPYYARHCQIKTKHYEGIPQALAEIGKKYPVAIVSNKPDLAVKPLCQQYFPGIYALGETAGVPRKPAADMVYKAMEAIGVETCVYVGDSEVDVLTAKNAGVPCVSVLWGFRDREDMETVGASYFCETAGQLVQRIEEAINGQ